MFISLHSGCVLDGIALGSTFLVMALNGILASHNEQAANELFSCFCIKNKV